MFFRTTDFGDAPESVLNGVLKKKWYSACEEFHSLAMRAPCDYHL